MTRATASLVNVIHGWMGRSLLVEVEGFVAPRTTVEGRAIGRAVETAIETPRPEPKRFSGATLNTCGVAEALAPVGS